MTVSDIAVRHALPRVLFHEDIALILDIDLEDARRRLEGGSYGTTLFTGGRTAILREHFEIWLQAQAQAKAVAGAIEEAAQ